MLHLEIAIAPSEIKSVNDLARLEDKFGFERGAVLSGFPKAWFKQACSQLGDTYDGLALERAIERLKELKNKKMVSFNRSYEGEGWACAARNSHEVSPFHRLVESSFDEQPWFIPAVVELSDDDFVFETQFSRDATSLAGAAKALLAGAEKITIYDPYLCPTKKGFCKTLEALFALCSKAEVEFHLFSEEDKKPIWEQRKAAFDKLAKDIPENVAVRWYFANDKGSGFLHQRGLFTAKGGLIYDRGFEEPTDHTQRNTPTDVTPMPQSMLEDKAKRYHTGSQHDDFHIEQTLSFPRF